MCRTVPVVGLCVCLLSHISPLKHHFVLEMLSRTQQATKVEKFVGFSVEPLHCGDPALPPLKAIHLVSHFPEESAHAHYSIKGYEYSETWVAPRVLHFSAFIS